MTFGGCAVLAAGAFAFSEKDPATRGQVPTVQSVAPAYPERAGVRLRLAQQYGTVCQTPQGSVCTVAPQPMNSRCECSGTFGLIVR